MKYKLINNNYENSSHIETILRNRNIENPQKYLSLDDSCIHNYSLLENIDEAVELYLDTIEKNKNIAILVDEDCDGIASASMMYNYTRANFAVNVSYILHSRKTHGLSGDFTIPKNTDLLIICDAGSNDSEECEKLQKKGIKVLVIDHHIIEKNNPHAVIVNNQSSSNYNNKSLSGSGMVWQFLRAVDDAIWGNDADNYLDLAALGIIGDSMDIREYENRKIIDLGLSNIQNKAFIGLLDKQSYSTGGEVNPISVAFYIVPLLNALIRAGTQEEKDLLFRAFIETNETFPYKKRSGDEIDEIIYNRVARLATNCKAKQNREVDKALELMRQKIEKYQWDENCILFCNGSEVGGNLTGLIAIKLANEYNKPCVFVRENKWKEGYLSGSIRNFDSSPISNLKDFLLSTGDFEHVMGHPNAAGLSILKSKIRDVIAKTNEMLAEVDFDKTYTVDFILSPGELTYDFVYEVNQLKDYYGQNISECMIAIENIQINTKDIEVMGTNQDTWKIMLNDEVSIIKFKCKEDDEVLDLIKNGDWGGEDICLTVVGKIGINVYNGISTPQCVVLNYNLEKKG